MALEHGFISMSKSEDEDCSEFMRSESALRFLLGTLGVTVKMAERVSPWTLQGSSVVELSCEEEDELEGE